MKFEPNSKTEWIVIADYNLTRIEDVRMMLRYAKERYGLHSILIRHNPTPVDHSLADWVINLDPLAETFVGEALYQLHPVREQIRAILPFSDNAVWSGARLARALGMQADDPNLAEAAFSKSVYREMETKAEPFFRAQNVFVPRFRKVSSLEEIEAFSKMCPNGFVLKPSCEGNNRGVIRLLPGDSLKHAYEEVSPYLAGGLIAEELIVFPEEYSFDGIGHLSWVTQKLSVHGRYPVEYGQKVPAPNCKLLLESVGAAGNLANIVVGQKRGPFHNEVKYDPMSYRSAVIEPNRRPAGMKIWHLAERVYGVNFFHLWVDQLVTGDIPKHLPPPKGVAAIRELPAPHSGMLAIPNTPGFAEKVFFEILDRLQRKQIRNVKWSEFRITATPGSWVEQEPKDNAGFVAEVCLYSPDSSLDVEATLQHFEEEWKTVIACYIEEEMYENSSIA